MHRFPIRRRKPQGEIVQRLSAVGGVDGPLVPAMRVCYLSGCDQLFVAETSGGPAPFERAFITQPELIELERPLNSRNTLHRRKLLRAWPVGVGRHAGGRAKLFRCELPIEAVLERKRRKQCTGLCCAPDGKQRAGAPVAPDRNL